MVIINLLTIFMEEENNQIPNNKPESPATNQESVSQGQNTNSDVDNGKVCAILSYLFIGIIWYFAMTP